MEKIMLSFMLVVLTSIPCLAQQSLETLESVYEQYEAEKAEVQDEMFNLTKAEIEQMEAEIFSAENKENAPVVIVVGVLGVVLTLFWIFKSKAGFWKHIAGYIAVISVMFLYVGVDSYCHTEVIVTDYSPEELKDADTYQKYLSERLKKNKKYLGCLKQLEQIEMKQVSLEKDLQLVVEKPANQNILVIKQKNAALKLANISKVEKATQEMLAKFSKIEANRRGVFTLFFVAFAVFVLILMIFDLKLWIIFLIEVVMGCVFLYFFSDYLCNIDQEYQNEFGISSYISDVGKEIVFHGVATQNMRKDEQFQTNKKEILFTEVQIRNFYK